MKFLVLVIPCLFSVAFLTLLERKILGVLGYRLGPNKVSFYGIFQPVGDALKLSSKQINSLVNFSSFLYYFSSILSLSVSLVLIFLVYSQPFFISFKFSFLVFFCLLSFNSFNFILLGWSSFSKFSLIGSIRSVCQLISYEASLYLCLFFICFLYSSFDLISMYFFFLFSSFVFLPFCFYIWVPSFLAELNRTPYDFSEGESELVSGFNTEFGSSCFTLIFLSEYCNIVFFCFLSSFLFFFCSSIFVLIFSFMIVWIRGVLPRFRFDKLMMLCWKFFIPFLTLFFIFFILLI